MPDRSEPTYEFKTFPMHDTGIGQEMGYANDKEFIEAVEAERAQLPQEAQDAIRQLEAEMTRSFLFGDAKSRKEPS
jgi:hypothetical protein